MKRFYKLQNKKRRSRNLVRLNFCEVIAVNHFGFITQNNFAAGIEFCLYRFKLPDSVKRFGKYDFLYRGYFFNCIFPKSDKTVFEKRNLLPH